MSGAAIPTAAEGHMGDGGADCVGEQEESFAAHQSVPQTDTDDVLVETFFNEGPLGVTLRRNAENGIVFVFDIVPDSQAVGIDVAPGDELWTVGNFDIGGTPLDKEAWKHMIGFIKESTRPLRMVWLRRAHPQVIQFVAPAEGVSSRPAPTESAPVPPSQVPPVTHSQEYQELEKLVMRLTFKDKDAKPSLLSLPTSSVRRNTLSDPSSNMILQEGRRILRQGDLTISTKGSKWTKPTAKRVILLSDMLLVATPQQGNVFSVENIIELPTCKIRSLGQVFGGDHGSSESSSVALDASFEILWPGGELTLVADSKEVKEVWVLNVYLAICECVSEDYKVLGWRHQYMLGTVHSAVLSRDEVRIRELVSYCQAGMLDYLAIDTADEDGYTPLHYACMLRMHNIVRILHEATADVTATDRLGFSSLHWAALQLDDVALEMLCSHVFDLDLHDSQGRTPLVLACLEGRGPSGRLDPPRLASCLKIMMSHKPSVEFANSIGETLPHILAGSWQHEALEQVLEGGVSELSALEVSSGMTALHYAALGELTRPPVGEAARIMNLPTHRGAEGEDDGEPVSSDGVDTLRVLLKSGIKMNLKDVLGRSALTILLDSAQAEKWERDDLEAAISVMLTFGCRADEANMASIKSAFPDLSAAALQEKWNALQPVDCARLEIILNHFELLVEEQEVMPTIGSSKGGDSKAGSRCKLCTVPFTMFRRNHHCRLCNVLCCDDCSKKRCVIDGAQVRTCDCCFNRILTMDEKFKVAEMLSSIRPLNAALPSASTGSAASLPVPGPSEKDKKESLFGFAFGSSSSTVTEQKKSEMSQTQQAQGSVSATMGVMNETRDKLLERGEKLSRMQEKTDEMVNNASEFARLARQLNEQQKSRWF